MPTTLGLDLGPNSIGWALVDEQAGRIIDAGVRVFPEGVDNFDTGKETSRNEQRRMARLMRRQHRRNRRRRELLREALVEAGLFPTDAESQESLLQTDPYPLRERALSEKLDPFEIGRVFYHLNQRRGFLSLRKRERQDKEVHDMLAEIEHAEAEREREGHETIGAWLAEKHANLDHRNRREDDHVRRRHLSRKQLEQEFDLIWRRQAELGHGDLLTEHLKYGPAGQAEYPRKPLPREDNTSPLQQFGVHGLIFFQRPIYWLPSSIGRCDLEPRHFRCPRADRAAQRFRMLQEVNNLRYLDPDGTAERALTAEQRALLLEKLSTRKEMTFEQIKRALGFAESVRFNLERGERPRLQGHVTDHTLASAKVLGPRWHELDERDKDRIVRALVDPRETDEAVERRLIERHGFTAERAEAAVLATLPDGYVGYSLKAIRKLLPELEKGLVVMAGDEHNSALHAAGYPDERPTQTLDELPTLDGEACPITPPNNPVVRRALVELRKVVNGIVRTYGKPDAIHLEMAREVQQGPEARRKFNKRLREREDERRRAADKLAEMGERVTRDKIVRLLLWEQQQYSCPYTGRAISQRQVFGGETDVDHILPFSRSLDNSQMNRVLVFRDANRDKGQRTVHEWLTDAAPQRYAEVCQRARALPYPKYRRFLQANVDTDSFIERQLVDTGYIARATGQYLRCLYDEPHRVLGLKGQCTAELRHQWGLGEILSELPDSPAWAEQADLRPGEKNRADHRHHAVDAIVQALTDRRRLHELARIRRDGGTRATGEALPDPWKNFRDDVEATLCRINVSHRPQRGIAGALHEDTRYGPTEQPAAWVVRKPLIELTPNEIPMIRDLAVRRIVEKRLADHGIEFGRGKKGDAKSWKAALNNVAMPSGVPIRKVRLLKNDKTIQPIAAGESNAHVKPGATHHVAIFEWPDNGKAKRDAVFVTMLDAAKRIKAGLPPIQRTPPINHSRIPADARFVMSLSRGEIVLIRERGQETPFCFSTAAQTTGQMWFYPITDARKGKERAKRSFNPSTLDARKVTIDPLGRIRDAND